VPHHSPARRSGSGSHTVSLYSFSKAYGMAGWRVGYAAVPRQLLASLAKVQDTVLICPPQLSQRAALAALKAGPDWFRPRIEALGDRRLQLIAAVHSARRGGLAVELLGPADGAFYGLLRFPCGLEGDRVMERLVLEHGVAALPGDCFGLAAPQGHGLLRLSYGMLEAADLAEALRRLFEGINALSQSPRSVGRAKR
jgi:aspartate/methionine/tyrosine aminotransferase